MSALRNALVTFSAESGIGVWRNVCILAFLGKRPLAFLGKTPLGVLHCRDMNQPQTFSRISLSSHRLSKKFTFRCWGKLGVVFMQYTMNVGRM